MTVVVPTYRRPRFLAQALESVVAQRVEGLRLVVYDNASNDETPAVVEAISRRHPVEYVRRPENLGAAGNIQAGLAAVRTPFCALLGDDDLQMPGFIASALALFDRHPSAMAFCGRTLVYDDQSHKAYRVQGSSWPGGFYRAGEATRRMVNEHFTFTGAVFKTEVFQALPFSGGDMEFMAQLAERFDFVVGEQLTAVWRMHQGSWTRQHAVAEERRAALDRLQAYLQLRTLDTDDRFQVVLRTTRELAHKSFHFALQAIIAGGREAALGRELRSAARILLSDGGDTTWANRLLLRGSQLVLGRGDRELSPARAGLLHALAAASSRLARPSNQEDDIEGAAIAYIDDIAQKAASWYAAIGS